MLAYTQKKPTILNIEYTYNFR